SAELADNVVKLALAYTRRQPDPDPLRSAAGLGPDDQAAYLERRSTDGHNLHPCGRTRLGWDVGDALAHDLESPGTAVGFVAIRRDLHTGDDLGALFGV